MHLDCELIEAALPLPVGAPGAPARAAAGRRLAGGAQCLGGAPRRAAGAGRAARAAGPRQVAGGAKRRQLRGDPQAAGAGKATAKQLQSLCQKKTRKMKRKRMKDSYRNI